MTARTRALSSRLQAARPASAFASTSLAPPVILPRNTHTESAPIIDFVTRPPVSSGEVEAMPPMVAPVAPLIERKPKSTGSPMDLLVSAVAHGLVVAALLIGPLLTRDLPPAGGEQAIPVEFLIVSSSPEDLVEGGASGVAITVELPPEIAPPTELALPQVEVSLPQEEPADIAAQLTAAAPPVAATPEAETPPPPPEKIETIEPSPSQPALLQPALLQPIIQPPPKPSPPDQNELRRQQALRAVALRAQQDKREAQDEAKQEALDLAREKRERIRDAALQKAAAAAALARRQKANPPAASAPGNPQASRPAAAGRAGDGQASQTTQRGGATNGAAAAAGAAEIASWRAQVIAHLARFKRYPAAAEEREITGRSGLSFTLSKSGQVLGVSLAGSSGHGILDQEALAMVRRATPFPAAPAGSPTSSSFNTAVRFDLR